MTLEEKKRKVAEMEWEDFTRVNNRGGRASCQDDRETFFIMRMSQYAAWPEQLLTSYRYDLQEAKALGRNLPAEKYAWMMEVTAPAEFAEIKDRLPAKDPEKEAMIDEIEAEEKQWFAEYAERYPGLASGNRNLEENRGSIGGTSMATYLRGELRTYSKDTVRLYLDMIRDIKQKGKNLSLIIMTDMMRRYGYPSLDIAEADVN